MRFLTQNPNKIESQNAILFMFEDCDKKSDFYNYLNDLSNGMLQKQIFEYKATKRSFLEVYKFSINENLKVFVAGLGKKEALTRKKFCQAAAGAARAVKASLDTPSGLAVELIDNLSDCNCDLVNFNEKDSAQMTINSIRIGLYEYSKYLTNKKPNIETIELVSSEITPQIEEGAAIGAYSSYAVKFAKDLINEPAQTATPLYIANIAQNIAKECNLEIKVYNKNEIENLKMNAFLAVAQGSANEPKFIHLTYKPKQTPRKKIALIGKGITFDAGGLDIKPAGSMLTMKSDMSGCASVLGVIHAVSKLDLDIELHVLSALCENMPSGCAYKQGDVLTAMNGKTIEIDNTDAEGRLTLADALCYADKLGVDEVIDIATLTGAVIVSLGNNITGVLGNNQKQIDKFIKISQQCAENTWQMPILDELKDNLKSEIADLRNTGGRNAGTSTAGWFLSNFTKSSSWIHLDIAGTAYIDKSNKETLSGPTGVMIRTLINYLISC